MTENKTQLKKSQLEYLHGLISAWTPSEELIFGWQGVWIGNETEIPVSLPELEGKIEVKFEMYEEEGFIGLVWDLWKKIEPQPPSNKHFEIFEIHRIAIMSTLDYKRIFTNGEVGNVQVMNSIFGAPEYRLESYLTTTDYYCPRWLSVEATWQTPQGKIRFQINDPQLNNMLEAAMQQVLHGTKPPPEIDTHHEAYKCFINRLPSYFKEEAENKVARDTEAQEEERRFTEYKEAYKPRNQHAFGRDYLAPLPAPPRVWTDSSQESPAMPKVVWFILAFVALICVLAVITH